MKKEPPPRMSTLKFIFVAMVFMLLADHFVFKDTRPYIEAAKEQSREMAAREQARSQELPVYVDPGEGKTFFEAPLPDDKKAQTPMVEPQPPQVADIPVAPIEQKDKPVLPKPSIHGKPKIAIIIDDLGMDVRRSREVVNLPAGVTLAFLPYAPKTPELAREGAAKGHSLIIHTPMEAMDASLNIGPGGLKANMNDAQFEAAFDVMLKSFDGYEGINNHMGSRLTQNKEKMDLLMTTLSKRGLFFVDSKTVGSSVAAHEAAANGVKFAERDVFLDHVDTAEFVRSALSKVEKLAARKGYAIAIGHPKDHTIAALRAWIPTLEEKGFELVPVKSLLVTPKPVTIEAKAPAPVEEVPVTMMPDPVAEQAAQVPSAQENVIYDMSGAPIVDPELDMFPEENMQVIAPSGYEERAPEIQLHPLPTQSPSP